MFLTAQDVVGEAVRGLTQEQWDQLAFGVIELDGQDVVRTYNAAESAMANRRAEDTVGKRFFAEVAPCTDAPAFRGRIAALSKAGDEVSFDYSFEFPWGSKRVAVRALFHDDSRWIFVTPIE